jgi:hypothetical protein
MTSAKVQEAIANALYLYNRPVNKALILTYEEALSDIKEILVIEAIKDWMKSEKFIFTPADIRKKIIREPSESDLANEVVDKVVASFRKFGHSRGSEAREYMGEVGWRFVLDQGGWVYLCENHGSTIDRGTFYAQAKKSIEVRIKSQPMASGGVALNPGQEQKYLDKK